MEKNKYIIKYSATYINQFNNILNYLVNNLNNRIAAENFYNKVIKEIETRSYNPTSYEKYISTRKRQNTYYKIYVKNYTIFYTVIEIISSFYIKRVCPLFYSTAPSTNIPMLSLYIWSNCEIGKGFSPKPASIVYPGLLYS